MKNKNILIIVGLILLILLSGCTIDSNDSNDKNVIKVDTPEQQLPKNIEVYDYIVDIEDTRYYDDYVLARYTIRTKDGSPINENKSHLHIKVKSGTIEYGVGMIDLVSKKISEDKTEVTSQFFIASNSNEYIEISYSLNFVEDNMIKEYIEINNIYSFRKTNEDYTTIINDKKTIDTMNITVESIGNFDFGSLFNFYIEYMKDYDGLDTNNYKIKFQSKNYISYYDIVIGTGLDKRHIKPLSKIENISEDAVGVDFCYSHLDYDPNSVDLDDFQIYLVNNDTKEETLLYSK